MGQSGQLAGSENKRPSIGAGNGNITNELKKHQPPPSPDKIASSESEIVIETPKFVQWITHGSGLYYPEFHVQICKSIPTGFYGVGFDTNAGKYFVRKTEYTTDNILELPMPEIKKIIKDITTFWKKEPDFKRYGLTYKRGILMYGPPGCHKIGTKIIKSDGSLINVENIKVGDLLMGPDSKSREVLKLIRGNEKMYKVIPNKGEPFVVNENHILSLKYSGSEGRRSTINISVNDFLMESEPFQERCKLYKTPLDFEKKDLKIPPYILGIWLGDGSSHHPTITNMDNEIVEEWSNYGISNGLEINILEKKGLKINKAKGYYLTCREKKKNLVLDYLRDYNLLLNKHIPFDYLTSSREDRLELLAGLIDSDGYAVKDVIVSKEKGGIGYNISTKFEVLSENILYLCRSLGFSAYSHKETKGCYVGKKKVFEGEYYRISIFGDCETIPVRVERKKCKPRKQIKNVLHTGFTLEKLKNEDYYGFIIDKDHLYVMDDFTVTHNCGKSHVIQLIIKYLIEEQKGVVFKIESPDDVDKYSNFMQSTFKVIENTRRIVTIIEDIDGLFHAGKSTETLLLNILDGMNHMENIVYVATTNYPEELAERIINRPSRFDRRYEITLPNEEVRKYYLEHTLKPEDLKEIDINLWVEKTENLSVAHLRELIVSTVIQGNTFDETIAILKDFNESTPTSKKFGNKGKLGFGASR